MVSIGRIARDWLLYVAAGILIGGASLPPNGKAQSEQAAAQQSITKSLESVAASLAQSQTSQIDNRPCDKGNDERASDLCAQWKAADAAQESAKWTRRGFWLGILTLVAAGAAALFAGAAAYHTRRSADVSEQAFVSLERPHIFVQNAIAEEPISAAWVRHGPLWRTFKVVYEVANYGRTPAIVKEIAQAIFIGPELPEKPIYNANDISDMEVPILGKPRELLVFYRGDLNEELINSLLLSNIHIEGTTPTYCYLYGYVRYESVHGMTDEVGFCWRHLVEQPYLIPHVDPRYVYRKLGRWRGEEERKDGH